MWQLVSHKNAGLRKRATSGDSERGPAKFRSTLAQGVESNGNRVLCGQRVRARHMKDHNPAATMLTVGPFPRPGVEAEVEAIAAKPLPLAGERNTSSRLEE